MANKMIEKKKLIFFGLLLIFLGGIIGFEIKPTEIQVKYVEKLVEDQRAMIYTEFNYYELSYDEKEVEIYFDIMNYGYTEAKDIIVKCYVRNVEEENVIEDTVLFGNLASQSFDAGILRTSNIEEWTDDFYFVKCYILSCDDNCIILEDRIEGITERI